MSEKRPLEGTAEMVNKLPPINKKRIRICYIRICYGQFRFAKSMDCSPIILNNGGVNAKCYTILNGVTVA